MKLIASGAHARGGQHEVALVLPPLVVDQDHHLAAANRFDRPPRSSLWNASARADLFSVQRRSVALCQKAPQVGPSFTPGARMQAAPGGVRRYGLSAAKAPRLTIPRHTCSPGPIASPAHMLQHQALAGLCHPPRLASAPAPRRRQRALAPQTPPPHRSLGYPLGCRAPPRRPHTSTLLCPRAPNASSTWPSRSHPALVHLDLYQLHALAPQAGRGERPAPPGR